MDLIRYVAKPAALSGNLNKLTYITFQIKNSVLTIKSK